MIFVPLTIDAQQVSVACRMAQKRGHVVLRLVALQVLSRPAPNLAQINVISFLTLPRKSF